MIRITNVYTRVRLYEILLRKSVNISHLEAQVKRGITEPMRHLTILTGWSWSKYLQQVALSYSLNCCSHLKPPCDSRYFPLYQFVSLLLLPIHICTYVSVFRSSLNLYTPVSDPISSPDQLNVSHCGLFICILK